METTRLSSKGQVIIPKNIRDSRCWGTGLELEVIETDNGILLKPKAPFAASSLDEVAGCLAYEGEAKTPDDIELAIKTATKEKWRGSN
ncbi:MAG: AbrB family transcriptional regulator [Gammaproteobacteria bacterium]|nr:MAG: AbrB family transcriptional regulator [Gammaproteobacteria bacterium]